MGLSARLFLPFISLINVLIMIATISFAGFLLIEVKFSEAMLPAGLVFLSAVVTGIFTWLSWRKRKQKIKIALLLATLPALSLMLLFDLHNPDCKTGHQLEVDVVVSCHESILLKPFR